MREADVRDDAVAEERADAALRAIEELIGDEQIERRVFFFQAPDRARRQQPLDAERLEAVDVRAEIQIRGLDLVSLAVTREEHDVLARELPRHVRSRRRAERRLHRDFLAVGQLRHVVQTAAADDADTYAHENPLAGKKVGG